MARKTKRPRTLLEKARTESRKLALATNDAELLEEPVDARRVWSLLETRTQEQRIEQLMLGSNSARAILRAMGDQFGLRRQRVDRMMARVRDRWMQEDQDARPANRAAAIRRVQQYLLMARGERAPQTPEERQLNLPGRWITKPDLRALERFESLLADLQGTRAPVQVELNVDVRVQQSLTAVISNLTGEQIAERLATARERRERLRLLDNNPPPVTQ